MLDELILNIASLKIYTAHADMDVKSLMKSMYLHQFRRIPVVDHKKDLIGIVTLNDLFLAIHASGDDSFIENNVDDIKNPVVLSIPPEYTIRETLQFMLDNQVTGVPICHNKQLTGIVTARDFLFQDLLWLNVQNTVIPDYIIKPIKKDYVVTPSYSSWQVIDKMIRINMNNIFVQDENSGEIEFTIKKSDLMKSTLLSQERIPDPNYLQTQTIDRLIMKQLRKIDAYDQITNVRKTMITRNSGIMVVMKENQKIGYIDELGILEYLLHSE